MKKTTKKESKSTGRYVESVGAKKASTRAAKNKEIAQEIAAKEMGGRSKKSTSQGLAKKIDKNAEKAGKNLKPSDVSKVRKDKKAEKYSTIDSYKRKKGK
jgi:hypothetical protein